MEQSQLQLSSSLKEITHPDELREEELHPMLNDLLEDDQLGLHEGSAKHLHNLLLLPALIPRRVKEDHALDGRLEEAAHHFGVGTATLQASEGEGDRLESEEEVAEEEAGVCGEREVSRSSRRRRRTATHP